MATLVAVALLAGAIAGNVSAAVKAPPKSVLVLKATWNPAGITPGSSERIPTSALASASQGASDLLRDTSRGFFGGWESTVRGPFLISAPRADSDEEGFQIGCGTQFFSDLTTRTDAAARAAGVNPDAHDLVVYAFDDAVCASMPENAVSAGLLDGRRITLQGETSAGNLAHMVGHYMGFGHAGSSTCLSDGAPQQSGATCSVDSAGDPYDLLGAGTGAFNAVTQSALGWFGDDAETDQVWDIGEIGPGNHFDLALTALTDPNQGSEKRAIRIDDGDFVYWLEYRAAIGVDAGSGTEGGTSTVPGLIVHRELPNPVAGGAPISRLIDMTPTTPKRDAGLPRGRTWVTPKTHKLVTLIAVGEEGVVVRVEGQTPLPPTPTFRPGPPVANPDPQRSVLVLNVGWAEGNFNDWSALDESMLNRAVATVNGSMRAWFQNSAPLGLAPGLQAHPGGSFTIAKPQLASGKRLVDCTQDERADFSDQIAREAKFRAVQAGFDLSRFRYILYTFTERFCEFDGLASGNGVFLTEATPGAMASEGILEHEFGHQLGLDHATVLNCLDDSGIQTVILNDDHCTVATYGDVSDVMGDSRFRGAYNAPHAFQLGWLNNQLRSLAAGDYSSTYSLKPFAETVREGTLRALRVQDGPNTLWVEYRLRVGVDLGVRPGVFVHLVRPGAGSTTQLLDMAPADPFSEAMQVGQTWANPLGTMRITLAGTSPASAQVTISSQHLSVPNLSGDSVATAEQRLRGLGLVYGGSTGQVDDCTGAFINKVIEQSPRAGTRVLPGARVTVRTGQKPRQMGNCQ
ncbi:MAG TPA: PASTA domain-containing protein [Solirubrobacterales bacterium]|nr:PASTA domain-containing protein [Solirubrobacterales bacterium]